MEHAKRKTALRPGNLVVIELHGVDGAAAKFVILRIGPEDRAQQYAGMLSFGMDFHISLCGNPSTPPSR